MSNQGPLQPRVRIGTLPGVWPPHPDAWLLAEVLREFAPGRDVLDVFTGSGVLAVCAAMSGARSATAIDISRRALLTVRMNALRNRCAVRALRGDLFAPVADERFDVIVANPPYLPGSSPAHARGIQRAWEGGAGGRDLIDRLLDSAARHLRPGGRLLLLHSSLNGEAATRTALDRQGMATEVAVRRPGPVGRITQQRAPALVASGILPAGEREFVEETLVFVSTAMPAGARPT